MLFKLRNFNLIAHSSYSSPAVRSHDSELSYVSILGKISLLVWATFIKSEWTSVTTSHSVNTAILSAAGSVGNTRFISLSIGKKKLWSPQSCCSVIHLCCHIEKLLLLQLQHWHTHWQKFHVLSTSSTWKLKIRLLMSTLSQVHRDVPQPIILIECMNFDYTDQLLRQMKIFYLHFYKTQQDYTQTLSTVLLTNETLHWFNNLKKIHIPYKALGIVFSFEDYHYGYATKKLN